MSSVVEKWVEKADYDLETARAMLNAKRYVYVLFCCQQAVEKMLKAVIVKRTSEMPPRTHSLMSLVEIIDLQLSTEQARLFRELTQFYIQSRYPEEETLAGNVHGDRAQEVLRKTEEAVSWLSSML